MAHYSYLQSFGVTDENTQEFLTALIIAGILLLFSWIAGAQLKKRAENEPDESRVIPQPRLSFAGVAEFAVESLANLQDSILGKENRKYLPLTGSLFLFIFTCNIIGLIPGMAAATTSVWITLGIALFIFVAFNYYGIKEQGFFHYIKHFAGPETNLGFFSFILAGTIFVIEIVSTFMRILTLNLRLYWNISADHMVLGIFTEMTQYIVPMFFLVLGLGVAFMQAFVPTVLTMVYIMLATQHGDDHHHEESGHH